MRKYIVTLLILSLCWPLIGQQEASIWYFGRNAGLDFNSGTPIALTDGALNTFEGCASIADTGGNLLFYTDGITVWNRNHVPMGNGVGLLGNPTSTQSAIIVPRPGDPFTYFIFTVDAEVGPDGMNYSEVNMGLNGGLGGVVSKNVPLSNPTTEKLTAVRHANGTDYWVLTHGWRNDEFLAYLVTAAGVSATPVISKVGLDLANPYRGRSNTNVRGYLKASPDGTKIGICHQLVGAELLSFDAGSGIVSNPIALSTEPVVYGLEFSPDSNVLYISYFFEVGSNFELRSSIAQYDITTMNALAIENSETRISGNQLSQTGALQLGIDGRIYAAQYEESYLGVINNPNTVGLGCNYIENGISLNGRISSIGLPPFIQSFFLSGILAQNFCLGVGTEFSINSSEPITAILWDFGDGNTSTMENPMHIYNSAGPYTVNVTVTTASDTATEFKDIVIVETPIANMVTDIEICTTNLNEVFNLSRVGSEVLGSQIAAAVTVSYHPTMADAQLGGNIIPITYTNVAAQETLFVRISSIENPSCHAITNFDILVKQMPMPSTITDVTICDDNGDGLNMFDLDTLRANLQANESPVFSTVSFHGSQADADTGLNPLPTNYTNMQPIESIYFRIQNSSYPECYDTGTIQLEVIEQIIANIPTDLEFCDENNDGEATFDLTQTEADIVGTQDSANLRITFHETQVDADAGQDAVDAQTYVSTSYQNIVYVRVENASDDSCYDTTSFYLNIFDTPLTPSVTDWQVCDDDNDGQYAFDLTEKLSEIQAGNNGISVTFHTSSNDAELDRNDIVGNYENTANPQPIYFRVENQNNAQCYAVGTFKLQVFDTPMADTASDIVVCDVDETGIYTFDLSQKDSEVLNDHDATVYEVSYFSLELEALNNENPLSRTGYQNNSYQETLWARIQHVQLDSCYDVSSFNVIVNPLPQLDLEERYVICPDSPALVIDGGDFETWSWQDANGTELSTSRVFDVGDLGEYQLTVTQTTTGIICENSETFEVLSSGAPETIAVETNGFSDQINVTVTATGTGAFEYSVDGENYQVSNVFKVFPGKYTVYVRDLEECRILSEEFLAIGYQRFFTPNGDGSNEFWNIIGGELYPESQLYIYDRYGKLLAQVSPNSKGWDGRLNGKPLPSSDYWFKYQYANNKTMTGHFALKR